MLVDADKQLGTTRASEVEDDAVREPPSPRRIDLPLRIASSCETSRRFAVSSACQQRWLSASDWSGIVRVSRHEMHCGVGSPAGTSQLQPAAASKFAQRR